MSAAVAAETVSATVVIYFFAAPRLATRVQPSRRPPYNMIHSLCICSMGKNISHHIVMHNRSEYFSVKEGQPLSFPKLAA
jgi:hypothetical protein